MRSVSLRGACRRAFLRTAAVLSAAAAAAVAPAAVHASDFPSRPLKLVIPFPPGGGADFMGREIGRRLGEALKQPVVVENKAGASGIIGTASVANAPADGYTLLLGTTGTHSSNAASYRDLPYDPVKSFAVVSIVADAPFLLCIHAGLGIETMQDFIAHAKANPGKLTYGSAGTGSSTHLGFEALKQAAGIQVVHVPYKGLPPAMADTLSGHVSMTFDSIPSSLPHLRSKRIKVLGIGSAKRVPSLPEVPTIAEGGLPGFTLGSWYGVFAPAGTPPAVVARLNAEIDKILRSGEFQERLAGVGATPMPSTPAEATAYLVDDVARWRKVASELNIVVQQ